VDGTSSLREPEAFRGFFGIFSSHEFQREVLRAPVWAILPCKTGLLFERHFHLLYCMQRRSDEFRATTIATGYGFSDATSPYRFRSIGFHSNGVYMGAKRSHLIGGLISKLGPVTIRYGLTLGLHWVGTSPITHRRHTVLQDGKTAIVFAFPSLRFFRRVLSVASSRLPHTYSVRFRAVRVGSHMHWRGRLVHMALRQLLH
jgi:hypothetical protein